MRAWWAACALVALLAAALGAQPRTAFPEKRGLKLTDFPRVVKLAENVYGYEEIRQPGFTTVSLIVVGADGVLLADGQGSPPATQTLLDHIARLTPKPLQVVRRRLRPRRPHRRQFGAAQGPHLHRPSRPRGRRWSATRPRRWAPT